MQHHTTEHEIRSMFFSVWNLEMALRDYDDGGVQLDLDTTEKKNWWEILFRLFL